MMIADKWFRKLSTTPSDINEHLPTLRRYAQRCDVVVELGVRYIVSTWAFAAAKPKKLMSVDIVDPDTHPAGKGCRLEHVQQACRETGTDFQFLLEDSRYADLPEHDLLFIDTIHNYAVLKEELRIQSPKTRNYIILHDTVAFGYRNEVGRGPGINKAIKEFLAANADWQVREVFPNNNGLTVLAKFGVS